MARAPRIGKAIPANTGPAKPLREADGSRSLIWLQGLLCGAVVTLATSYALLIGVMLAPAAIAYRLDRQHGRPVARAVMVFALAGSIQPLHELWRGGSGMAMALGLLGDVRTWLPAWAASGGGWLLAELAPIFVRIILDIAARSRAARLRAQRTRLEQEWGIPPTPEEDEPISPQTPRSG